MARRRWRLATGPGDFVPIFIGCILLFVSLPAFLLLLLAPESNYGIIGPPMLALLGIGVLLGAGFLVRGVQLCATPGSLAYRIAHGRLFRR